MKTIYIIIAFLIVGVSSFGLSQNDKSNRTPDVSVMEEGNLILFGFDIPKNGIYQLERKVDGQNYKMIGKVKTPKNEKELKKLQKKILKEIPSFQGLADKDLKELWGLLQKTNKLTELGEYGGAPITRLLVGTAFFDSKKLKKDQSYSYRVTLLDDKNNKIYSAESVSTSTLKDDVISSLYLSEKDFLSGKVSVVMTVDGPQKPTPFNVYRSEFGRNRFNQLNLEDFDRGYYSKNDSIYMVFEDSIGYEKEQIYEYKIVPTDIYGKESKKYLSFISGNVIENYAPYFTHFTGESLDSNHQVKLSWDFERKNFLNGITIMKSDEYDGEYHELTTLTIYDSVYYDNVSKTGVDNYYYLKLHSLSNKPLLSDRIFAGYYGSSGTPIAPIDVDANTIENGIEVRWRSNNIYGVGHIVYRKPAKDSAFVQISDVIPATIKNDAFIFIDTSRTLKGAVAYDYAIKTINQDKQVSENSEIVSAYAGVPRHLTPPMNLRFRLNNKEVTLIWDDMLEWDEHISHYNLYRKKKGSDWESLPRDTSAYELENKYIDKSISSYGEYSYAVESVDFFNNISERAEIQVDEITPRPLPAPAGGELTQTDEGIIVSWGQTSTETQGVKIYRSVNGGEFILIETTKEEAYHDTKIQANTVYSYQLSYISNEGIEGKRSDTLNITIFEMD